ALLIQTKKKKGPTRTSVTTILFCNIFVLVIVLSLIATHSHWLQRSRGQTGSGLSTFEVNDVVDSKKYDLPGYAVLNTSKGYLTIELFKDAGPKHEAFMVGTTKVKEDSKAFQLFITTAPIPDLNDKLFVLGRVIKGEDVVQIRTFSLVGNLDLFWWILKIEEIDTNEHYQPKSPIGITATGNLRFSFHHRIDLSACIMALKRNVVEISITNLGKRTNELFREFQVR
ncbi:Cyclophilin-type peptidyl-prolyl cis-trans isomerase domain - like 10, partial [Theobroma cacao]